MYTTSAIPVGPAAPGLRVRSSLRASLRAGLLLAAILTPSASAQRAACTDCASSRPLVAAAEIVSINLLTWSYDRYVADAWWTRVSPSTWAENLRRGLVWDGNRLTSNQLMHPLHGALAYTAARSNGHGYGTSMAGAGLGSLLWEFLGEMHPASPNDLINTTVGGAALGETMHRLSAALRASGGRAGRLRRLAAGALSPFDALHGSRRLEASEMPGRIDVGLTAGFDHALGALGAADARLRPVTEVVVRYGDPLEDVVRRPFDVFEFRLRVGRGISSGRPYGPENPIDRLESRGALLSDLATTGHFSVGIYQHLDYARSPASEFGGQSITVGAYGRGAVSGPLTWSGSLHLGALVFGSSPARLVDEPRRTNDYGPGAVAKLDARIAHRGRDLLLVEARASWLHGMARTRGDHVVGLVGGELRLPVVAGFGVGAGIELSGHTSFDDEVRMPHAVSTSARFALTWSAAF